MHPVSSKFKASKSSSSTSIKENKRSTDYFSPKNELKRSIESSSFQDNEVVEIQVTKSTAIKSPIAPIKSSKRQKPNNRPKPIDCHYIAVDEDSLLENEIAKVKNLGELTADQIYYMVLRDINYSIAIISGNCEHSWRHKEFKKFSHRLGNVLYENAAINSYREEQYTAAVRALRFVFCKKDSRLDEYIIKVLMPEALIKICMRVYQCGKRAAEEYLKRDNSKTNFKFFPNGSAIYLSPLIPVSRASSWLNLSGSEENLIQLD